MSSPVFTIADTRVGAIVSTVNDTSVVGLTFPAMSSIVILILTEPSMSGVSGVHVTERPTAGLGLHVHPVIVTTSPISVGIMIFGNGLDEVYGAEVSQLIEVMIGADGPIESTTMTSVGADEDETLPAVSV